MASPALAAQNCYPPAEVVNERGRQRLDGSLDSTVQIAIVAFQEAWMRINTVMGWDNAKMVQDWGDDLAAIFNP